MRIARKAAVGLLALALIASLPSGANAALSIKQRATRASGFVADGQNNNGSIPSFSTVGSTADAIIALTVAGRGAGGIRKALRYLGNQVADGKVTSVGLQAKVALAAIAGNKNPHDFGGQDLIANIEATEQGDGRYGASTAVFDQADAILALQGAGTDPSSDALNWLADAQCPDGGWQYDEPYDGGVADDSNCNNGDPLDFFYTDTNTSALAAQALAHGPNPAVDPFDFFDAIRDGQYGGWGYTWVLETTDANSTGLVLMAYYANGDAPPAGAAAALRKLQYNICGAFSHSWVSPGVRTGPDLGATVGALPALKQKFLPVPGTTVTQQAPDPIACPA